MRNPTGDKERPWTILDVLKWTASHFASHHIESPRASAEILLAHALGLNRIDLYLRYDQPLAEEELAGFKPLIRRRLKREPVAYITGTKEFWSMPLEVSPDVLIPRPETECLVAAALEILDALPAGARALDLGAGSGAVILALASERPGHLYFASDVSLTSLRTAKQNARRRGLAASAAFFAGDWCAPLKPDGPGFDLILSNPPYIRTGDIDGLQPEISRWEPRQALDGGEDGLGHIRRIIAAAGAHLNRSGALLMEIGHDQAPAVAAAAGQSGKYAGVDFLKDYSGIDRVARLYAAA